MHTTQSRLQDAFPFLGERAATENDLFDICERRGIAVVFAHEISRGLYVMHDGREYIFLNAMLHGWSLLYVFAHEIGHAILHAPRLQRTMNNVQRTTQIGFDCRRKHAEAERAAALLLLPMHEVERLREADGPEDENLTRLVALRIDHWAATGY